MNTLFFNMERLRNVMGNMGVVFVTGAVLEGFFFLWGGDAGVAMDEHLRRLIVLFNLGLALILLAVFEMRQKS